MSYSSLVPYFRILIKEVHDGREDEFGSLSTNIQQRSGYSLANGGFRVRSRSYECLDNLCISITNKKKEIEKRGVYVSKQSYTNNAEKQKLTYL
jgi:hypothetical protein